MVEGVRKMIAGSFPTPCIFPNEGIGLIGVPAEIVVNALEPIPVLQIFYNIRPRTIHFLNLNFRAPLFNRYK
jgi:hypothetical protein